RRRRGVHPRRADARDRRLPPRAGGRIAVSVSREDGVAVVTLDRPEALNALDRATLTELRDRLQELAGDEGVRAVVLTGAGDRAFVAGADIREMSAMGVEEARAWGQLGHDVARLLET